MHFAAAKAIRRISIVLDKAINERKIAPIEPLAWHEFRSFRFKLNKTAEIQSFPHRRPDCVERTAI